MIRNLVGISARKELLRTLSSVTKHHQALFVKHTYIYIFPIYSVYIHVYIYIYVYNDMVLERDPVFLKLVVQTSCSCPDVT